MDMTKVREVDEKEYRRLCKLFFEDWNGGPYSEHAADLRAKELGFESSAAKKGQDLLDHEIVKAELLKALDEYRVKKELGKDVLLRLTGEISPSHENSSGMFFHYLDVHDQYYADKE